MDDKHDGCQAWYGWYASWLQIGIMHIGALWTEGPFEKFQFYVLPMKNLFFPQKFIQYVANATYWICM